MNFSIEGFLLLCSLSILLEFNVGTVSGFAFFVVKDYPQTHHQHDQRRCEHKFNSGHVTNKQSNFILKATASSSSSEGRRKLGYSKEGKRIMRNQSRTRSSQKSPNLSVSSQNQPQQQKKEPDSSINTGGIRLNKVLKATHSRRQADKLIAEGRLRVNGLPVESKGGFFVIPYKDEIMLDGKIIHGWEDMNVVVEGGNNNEVQGSSTSASSFTKNIEKSLKQFDYIKYWKPTGVICTTDRTIRNNIIHAFTKHSSSSSYKPKHRIYPVGRLDKETSGLIILTSDGRLPNAVLRGDTKQPKRYKVRVDKILNERDVQKLRDGVVITTVAQRDGKKADPLTQRTKRCQVNFPLSGGEADIPSLAYNDNKKKSRRNDLSYWFEIILMEGRNRQIRKMCGALGYTVLELQRVEFMGIHLEEQNNNNGLNGPGDWALLDEREMDLIASALQNNT